MKYFDYKLIGFTPYNKWGDCIEYSDEEISTVLVKISDGYRLMANEDHTYQLTPPDETQKEISLMQKKIQELKTNLSVTDYQAIKFAEGEMSAEDYADMKTQRAEWRAEINQLEEKLNSLGENNNE